MKSQELTDLITEVTDKAAKKASQEIEAVIGRSLSTILTSFAEEMTRREQDISEKSKEVMLLNTASFKQIETANEIANILIKKELDFVSGALKRMEEREKYYQAEFASIIKANNEASERFNTMMEKYNTKEESKND